MLFKDFPRYVSLTGEHMVELQLQLYIFRWLPGALVVVLVLICLRCGGLWYNFNQGAKC